VAVLVTSRTAVADQVGYPDGTVVGSALLRAAIAWARGAGLHKLCLEVFAHNEAGIALYRKAGFVEEGRRTGQYRRASGELWDAIVMGLAL